MLQRLSQRLKLERAELLRALSLGGTLFALTGSYTLVKTARDALFLARLPASTLPYVFLGVGVLTVVATALFTRATRRRPTHQSLAAASLGVAISLAVFSLLFRGGAPWIPIAFYLWVNVYGLIVMSQFWSFANSVSDPREAKRIYGIVGLGGIVGGLVGGLLAAPLAQRLGLPSLLIVAAVLAALVAPRVYASVHWGHVPAPERPPADDAGMARVARHPYVRWLALAALCSVLVTALLDYQFKVEIQRRFVTPAEMASFLGGFYTAINVASLAVQLFLTRWALQSLGSGWSAAVLPGGLGIGAALTMIVPGFGAVLGSRLWDQVMRQSLNRSAVELFYFPLEPALRRRAKAAIEAGLERVGDGLAGLAILGLAATLGASTWTLALLVAVLIVVWVIAWLSVRRGYVDELAQNLKRMNLEHQREPVSLREASLLKEMIRLLDSPFERVVLHGIALLEDTAPEELDERLPALLAHETPAVRARALGVIATRRLTAFEPRIHELLMDADHDVRIAALRAHCAGGCDDPAARIEEYLGSDDPRLKAAAIQLAVEFASPDAEAKVRAVLDRLVREGTAEERVAVARALGRRAAPSVLHDLLSPLLRDAELEVRRAALESAGRAQRRTHIPVLIEGLAARSTQAAARAGLAGFGDRVVGTLGDYLSDSTVAPDVRHRIPYVLGDIATQEAVAALLRFRETGDVRLWYRILKAENRIRAADPRIQFPRARVVEDLLLDARAYFFAYVHYRACPLGDARSAERLLCLVLNERLDQSLNRAFRRLGLLYPPAEMLAAYQGVISEQSRLRGSALEYLENALAPDHRALVLPMVDDAGDEARVRFAASRFGYRFVDYNHTLNAILEGDDQWLRTCALFVVGARKERALADHVEAATASLDLRVRETANWARFALEAG